MVEEREKHGVVINPVIAIDDQLNMDNRETLRERLEEYVVRNVEEDNRFKEVRASIRASGYIDEYERHGVTFQMYVNGDRELVLNRAASAQQFLDKVLLSEGFMDSSEYRTHTETLRTVANDVAEHATTDILQ